MSNSKVSLSMLKGLTSQLNQIFTGRRKRRGDPTVFEVYFEKWVIRGGGRWTLLSRERRRPPSRSPRDGKGEAARRRILERWQTRIDLDDNCNEHFEPLENIYSRFCSGFVLLSLLLSVGGARRHSGRRRDREAIGEYLYRLASTSHIL